MLGFPSCLQRNEYHEQEDRYQALLKNLSTVLEYYLEKALTLPEIDSSAADG